MTLLTVCQDFARDVGLDAPDVVISSSAKAWKVARVLADATGEELARRVDWPQLRATVTINGTGANDNHDLPAAFMRTQAGAGASVTGGFARPLSAAEWNTLTAVEGVPRYYYIGASDTPGTYPGAISFWPYLASGSDAILAYQSQNFCTSGAAFAADGDEIYVDEDLFLKGLGVRWRRQQGMDFADYEAEYEAALADLANAYGGMRP